MAIRNVCVSAFIGLSVLFSFGNASAADAIRLGQIAVTTGADAKMGVAEIRGATMAVNRINAQGGVLGRPLELFVQECAPDKRQILKAAKQLVEGDNVVAVIGPGGDKAGVVATKYFDEQETPHVATLVFSQKLVWPTENSDTDAESYNHGTCVPELLHSFVPAAFIARHLDLEDVVLMVPSGESGESRKDPDEMYSFTASFSRMGGHVTADAVVDEGEKDFSAQFHHFSDTNPQALVFDFTGTSVPFAIKQAREKGFTQPIVMRGRFDPSYWDIAGDALENTYWVSQANPDNHKIRQFLADYKEQTGEDCPDLDGAVLAYDAVYLLKNAIERAEDAELGLINQSLAVTEALNLLHYVYFYGSYNFPHGKDVSIVKANPATRRLEFVTKVHPTLTVMAQ